MDNSKPESDDPKSTTTAHEENPNNNIIINSPTISPLVEPGSNVVVLLNETETETETENQNRQPSTARTPFNNLSQVDADLALARTLQNQERAYMMLRMNGDGSTYGTWAPGSYAYEDDDDFDDPSGDEYDGSDDDDNDDDDDEDAFDVHAHAEAGEDDNPGVQLDPAAFPSDEAYARALQDAEDREMAARLLALAGMNDMVSGEDEDEDTEDHDVDSQDTWEEVDPDELSYEELLALGEVVGTESRGLSAESIASLPLMKYKPQSSQAESSDPCVICRLDYEDGDTLTVLACKHSYHSECINNWLQINKVCPVCSTEVSTSGNS